MLFFPHEQWHSLSREEQAKYYDLARKERQLHSQLYPGWSARDNYVSTKHPHLNNNGILDVLLMVFRGPAGPSRFLVSGSLYDTDTD